MHVVVSGATGTVGTRLVASLRARGDTVHVLSRNPERATATLGVPSTAWDPIAGPPDAEVLRGASGVLHLAGETVAQRWSDDVKRRIRDSRELGTRNLVAAIGALPADERPAALVCASATGYYGPCTDRVLEEDAPAGDDFLADVCVAWEHEAAAVTTHAVRHCSVRTGMVLDTDGGALAKMLPPFKLGAGGPVAGGRQYVPWIHSADLVSLYLRALDDPAWNGVYNGSAPQPVTSAVFSKALGKALHRPAVTPVPAFALRLLYGEMAELITAGQRAVPARPQASGFTFAHADLDAALADLLS